MCAQLNLLHQKFQHYQKKSILVVEKNFKIISKCPVSRITYLDLD